MVGLIEDIQYLNDFIQKQAYIISCRETRNDFGGSQIEKLLYSKVNHEYEEIDLGDEVAKAKQ